MNTQPLQMATSNHDIVAPHRRSRRFLPYLSVIVLTLLCVGLAMVLDVLPSPGSAYSKSKGPRHPPEPQPVATPQPAEQLLTISTADVPLLTSLQERQARLEALEVKERQLAEREEGLRLVQQQIEAQVAALTMLRQEIEELLAEKEAFEAQRLEHLVKVYEGMRAAEAASLVERLNEETAVQLFFRMKDKKVGKILEAIKPDVAARLSERLAAMQQKASDEGIKEQTP
jgi:flagellar motility protein MotE (MotC chaperone)